MVVSVVVVSDDPVVETTSGPGAVVAVTGSSITGTGSSVSGEAGSSGSGSPAGGRVAAGFCSTTL